MKGSDEPFGVIDLAKRGDLRLQWAMMVLSCPRLPRFEETARQPDA